MAITNTKQTQTTYLESRKPNGKAGRKSGPDSSPIHFRNMHKNTGEHKKGGCFVARKLGPIVGPRIGKAGLKILRLGSENEAVSILYLPTISFPEPTSLFFNHFLIEFHWKINISIEKQYLVPKMTKSALPTRFWEILTFW